MRNSRQRLEPLIRSSPVLSELIPEGARRGSGNTLLSKEFPGGILVMVGAQSAASLRSMPARYVFMDEVDGYPASTDEEGDPVTLAEARTVTFGHRRKVFLVSTPTTRGGSSCGSRITAGTGSTERPRRSVPTSSVTSA